MLKKVYFLSTCDTCKRIMKEANVDDSFDLQDVKYMPLSLGQIEELRKHTDCYEELINKRARKLKDELALNPVTSDMSYRDLLLKDYTFLKRPVFLFDDRAFIGNAKKNVDALLSFLDKK